MNRRLSTNITPVVTSLRSGLQLSASSISRVTRKQAASRATAMQVQELQTKLHLQNEALRQCRADVEQAEARCSDLYESGTIAYITLGADGAIRQLNRASANLLDTQGSRLVETQFRQMVAADDRPTFDMFIDAIFESGAKQTCEVAVRHEHGAPLLIEFTGLVVSERDECRLVATDITGRKREELEREELQSQLAQSRKMEAIGALAGGIAHDFNNILGGILGGLSWLDLELRDDDEHHAMIREMEELVQRGANLTRQLLGFACRGKYDVRPLDLADVVSKTCAMFGRTRKDVSIHVEVASDLRAVLMDHTQLEQVLLNLLVNASQAMPDGGRIHLSAENTDIVSDQLTPPGAIPGQFVTLNVADQGVGMDAATQARIFDPFFTTKAPGQGTGLGLASVYGIIKSHAGFVTVESELGQGTTFSLVIPAARGPTASEIPQPLSVQRGTGTILVVDDEAQMVKVYSRVLEKLGYAVLTASGGAEALSILRQRHTEIALVILDMIMPDMNGRQTFDAMRMLAPNLRVLLSSGFTIDRQAQDMLARGCVGFIQKPFDAATLSAKLRKVMSR